METKERKERVLRKKKLKEEIEKDKNKIQKQK